MENSRLITHRWYSSGNLQMQYIKLEDIQNINKLNKEENSPQVSSTSFKILDHIKRSESAQLAHQTLVKHYGNFAQGDM